MSIGFPPHLAQSPGIAILMDKDPDMRKMLLPLSVFIVGLVIADYFLGIDVLKLFNGFVSLFVESFRATRE
jgi:hypothetical protein